MPRVHLDAGKSTRTGRCLSNGAHYAMRVGISVLTHAGHNIWENGLGQNVFFLARLLRTVPFVQDVVLINCGDQAVLPPGADEAVPGISLLAPRDATHKVDVVIELGGGLNIEWLDYLRAQGKKVVFFCCGQPYVGLIEPTVFNRSGYFSRAQRCDEIWILPKDRALKPMLEALHRCPVLEVPFLWESFFIDQRAASVERAGFQFGYAPVTSKPEGPRSLRVAVFEPNISVVKCSVLPMLACDLAFRSDPRAVHHMHVLNSIHMKDHPSFVFLTSSLDLYKTGRIHLDHRHDFVGYVSQHVDAVVAHQWQNEQNILYLDALYGGYPLIHNSPWLRDLGYYYPDSDVEHGAQRLLDAANLHDLEHLDYVRRSRAFLARLNPRSPDNGAQYAQRLLDLMTRPRTQGGAW